MVEREQSEFNSAFNYLARINVIIFHCQDSAINLDAHNWFHGLMALFRELSTEMKPDEIQKHKVNISLIREKVAIHNRRQSNGAIELSADLHDDLQNFDLELRKVMRECGLQQKLAEDARRALR